MTEYTTSVYKRKDGRWEGQLYHDINPKTGRRKKISVYAKTSQEAKQKLQRLSAEMDGGIYVPKSKLTLEAWLIQWLKVYALPKVKQSSYNSYYTYVYRHINPNIGKVTLKHLQVDMLQEFFNEKAKSGRLDGKGGLSAKTLRNMHTMLKTALKQAVENDLIIKNPAIPVKLPPVMQKEMRVLTPEEQNRLVEALKISEERYAIGILICLFTGMRVGELCGLQWGDYNISTSELSICRTLSRLQTMEPSRTKTEIVISTPKSQHSIRTIPIPDVIKDQLLAYKKERNKEKKLHSEIYNVEGFIICNELGSPVEPRTIYDVFKRLLTEADIEDAPLHCLRHTFATRAVELGMDIKTLSDVSGHADVSTTLNRYSHSLDAHKRKAMDMMGSLYE